MDYSVVQFLPSRSGHSCGYCKSSNGSVSDGMWAHTMTVRDYQELIDRGWRRSGQYCYKPKMNVTCCPAYTIKCAALDIQLTKSQKKILKRMRKFLIDGKKESAGNRDFSCGEEVPPESCSERIRLDSMADSVVDIKMDDVDLSGLKSIEDNMDIGNVSSYTDGQVLPSRSSGVTVLDNVKQDPAGASAAKQKKNAFPCSGRDLSKPLMKKAKLIRQERRERKQMANAKSEDAKRQPVNNIVEKKSEPLSKSLEDFLNEPLPKDSKHSLEIKLVKCDREELVSLEWPLYVKYQMTIHHDKQDDCDNENFQEFLVSSPLKYEYHEETPEMGFGSFHQQYWLDGELIAVGVIDILPSCVSSVYFFYDPDYSFLSLGTYSTLREVEFVRHLNIRNSLLKYYYMGFYIHSCPKMRYKGKIGPSFLLCPEIYTWHPIETCLPKLDQSKYSRLNNESHVESKDSNIDINKVLILWKNVTVDFRRFKRLCKKEVKTDEILYYAKLVGRACSQRLLLHQ